MPWSKIVGSTLTTLSGIITALVFFLRALTDICIQPFDHIKCFILLEAGLLLGYMPPGFNKTHKMAVRMAQKGWFWVWASARCLRADGVMYRWLGWGASRWVCISSAHLVVTEGKKWQKSLFMPCRQEDSFCWRGDASQDSTRFRPKVVWECLGASNPRLFVFYKDGIDGCCFLGRRKESSSKQNKTKNRIP